MLTATETPKGLDEVKNLADQFVKERQRHLDEARRIEQSLLGLRQELDSILGNPTAPETPVKRKPGRPAGSRNRNARVGRPKNETPRAQRSGRSRGRNGGLSGTQKIEAILEKAPQNRMSSGDLTNEAKKQGIPNPHSSYQSLKRRQRIEMKDGFVTLLPVSA